jgi:lipid II:glycine glycyltransferase (peptidoglycan interpeptide bridge formation enzyme)
VADAVGAAQAAGLAEALDAHARDSGFDGVELRTHPGIFDAHRSEELLYAYARAGYEVRQVELSTYLDLARFGPASGDEAGLEEAIMASFSSSCRRACRKALKEGVEARVSDDPADLERFWEILRDNLARRHDTRPTHTAEELAELRERFEEDIVLVASYDGDEMLGGLVAFVLNDRAAHVFYFASLAEAQAMRPLNLAVLRAVEHAVRRGLRVLNLGISTEEGGRVANWGLFRFKESFGGRGVVRLLWGKDLRG